MMWKILTAQIRCHKRTRRIGHLQYIDQLILKESKVKWKNIAMMGIDFKKAYDIVTQSWIVDCGKMYEISDKVIKFITEAMKDWKEELVRKTLAEVKILRDIFQGDVLLPLSFVIAIIPLNHLPRKCTGGY